MPEPITASSRSRACRRRARVLRHAPALDPAAARDPAAAARRALAEDRQRAQHRRPSAAGRRELLDGRRPGVLRIAPDTWLLESALHEAADLVPAVRTGCGRRSFAVTDVSDSLVTIADRRRGGRGAARARLRARPVLAAFGNPACARTRLAQLPVVLRRVNSERFECLVDRSAAQWLYDWLVDAAAGLWAGHR